MKWELQRAGNAAQSKHCHRRGFGFRFYLLCILAANHSSDNTTSTLRGRLMRRPNPQLYFCMNKLLTSCSWWSSEWSLLFTGHLMWFCLLLVIYFENGYIIRNCYCSDNSDINTMCLFRSGKQLNTFTWVLYLVKCWCSGTLLEYFHFCFSPTTFQRETLCFLLRSIYVTTGATSYFVDTDFIFNMR